MEFSADLIAQQVGGIIEGDGSVTVSTFSKIEEAGPGSITFLANPKYTHFIYSTGASIILVRKDFIAERPVKATLIKVDDPYATLSDLLTMVAKFMFVMPTGVEQPCHIADGIEVDSDSYVGAFAYIGDGAHLGKAVKIFPQTYIGRNVEIGDGSIIYPGVKIYEGCKVGARCILHAGAVIGADGFGFMPNAEGGFDKIPQLGNVVIEDDVEIGANTCIDRAKTDSTVIRHGVKLDNLIQIGHNVEIGANTVSSAQTGIAGTSKVGSNCFLAGQVGVADHVTIGNRVQVGSKSGIDKSVPDGEIRFGYPALPGMQYHRSSAVFKRLPELDKRVRDLEKAIEELKK